uniref:NP3 n=1 Tax=Octopus kaurna TaxID=243731 RepID=B6Z1Z1_OCTKA|nr:NP3 [Octopus kaurna]
MKGAFVVLMCLTVAFAGRLQTEGEPPSERRCPADMCAIDLCESNSMTDCKDFTCVSAYIKDGEYVNCVEGMTPKGLPKGGKIREQRCGSPYCEIDLCEQKSMTNCKDYACAATYFKDGKSVPCWKTTG